MKIYLIEEYFENDFCHFKLGLDWMLIRNLDMKVSEDPILIINTKLIKLKINVDSKKRRKAL